MLKLKATPPQNPLRHEDLQSALEEVCSIASSKNSKFVLACLREKHISSILKALGKSTSLTLPKMARDGFSASFPPLYHGIVLADRDGQENMKGFAIVHFAYSSWEGRVLHMNHLHLEPQSNQGRRIMLVTLAKAALQVGCVRLVWQHKESDGAFYKQAGAETLNGVLTLQMNQVSMDDFLSTQAGLVFSMGSIVDQDPASVHFIRGTIDTVSANVNQKLLNSETLRLRRSTRDDIASTQRLVHCLADHVKESDALHLTQEQFLLDGFDAPDPLYYCLILEDCATGTDCGIAFFYFGYDIHSGRFLHLEDLFFEEHFRGKGAGTAVMAALTAICRSVGCANFLWQSLDWNARALAFYDRIGGKIQDGLLTSRFAGNDLVSFVERGTEQPLEATD